MTSLEAQLLTRIHADGPIPISTFMQDALLHPEHGYYTTQLPFGAAGDFVTAPEISQMFGELIGLCLAQYWIDLGKPKPFNLVELGPGRGTLMADLLRATRQVPAFLEDAQVHLVEASPTLRSTQRDTLGSNITHHEAIDTLPRGTAFFIANEFFDALPIRQFVRDGSKWRERVVGESEDKLAFGLSAPTSPEWLKHRLDDTEDGDLVEVSLSANTIAAEIGARISSDGGCALIFDYGDWRSLGDTLQAVRNHRTVDVLEKPGTADLTAHVDFEALAVAAKPAVASRLTPQGVFLERLGITGRAQSLAKGLEGDRLDQHVAAHRRLTHPDEMGTLFKALALVQSGAPLPPGFMS